MNNPYMCSDSAETLRKSSLLQMNFSCLKDSQKSLSSSLNYKLPLTSYDYVYNNFLKEIDLESCWTDLLSTEFSIIFFKKVLKETLENLNECKYSLFDAHTTSNCCHGISLFVSLSIQRHKKEAFSYQDFLVKAEQIKSSSLPVEELIQSLPAHLLVLTSAFILCQAGILEEGNGRVTDPLKLKDIFHEISKKFAIKLTKNLQKRFSKAIARSYLLLSQTISELHKVSGISTKIWAKYIEHNQLRVDKRGLHYSSCMYSTQVTLAFLATQKKNIAIVSDIISSDSENKGKYIFLMRGDGESFIPAHSKTFNSSDPVFVVGGYTVSDSYNVDNFAQEMNKWLDSITSLILSADTYYPQFPKVSDDSNFDNSPISPEEPELQMVIQKASKLEGVSKDSPFFFFQNHYYPASYKEVALALSGKPNILPFSPIFTPQNL